jgi:sulfur-carrier protein adenylyltransferase/sulfurtransferase
MLPELSQEEVLRYSRHLIVPEVGIHGQQKLKAASALIIGSGGLGSPIALYLAAAGIGHIGLVDFDVVESSNLQRQVIHSTEYVGRLKVESARKRLQDLNPYIQVDIYPEPFQAENAPQIAAEYDVLLDGTDNFAARYLINDLCVLEGKPYVYGSIFKFEGQVSVFDARYGPCYRCIFPDPPPEGAILPTSEVGLFGVLPGTIGTIQATEAIKLILGIGKPLYNKLLLYDALDMTLQPVLLQKNSKCKICGSNPEITQLENINIYQGTWKETKKIWEVGNSSWYIEPSVLRQKLSENNKIQVVDVREPVEQLISQFPGSRQIPFGKLADEISELDPNQEVILICRNGQRSYWAYQRFQAAGFSKVRILRGGLNAWVRQVDGSMLEY